MSIAPTLYTISPNLKRTVTYMNTKNVGFTNSHVTHLNYPISDRLVITSNKDTKNT